MNRFLLSASIFLPLASLAYNGETIIQSGKSVSTLYAPLCKLQAKHQRRPSDEIKPPLVIDGIRDDRERSDSDPHRN